MKLMYPASIKDGKLFISSRKSFDKEISEQKNMYVRVTVEKAKKKRSNQQNRYWWGVCIPYLKNGFKDLGYRLDSEETHDFVKHKFCRSEIISVETGEILETVKGTSKMSTTEFMDLIADIQEWAAIFMNVEIPDPDITHEPNQV